MTLGPASFGCNQNSPRLRAALCSYTDHDNRHMIMTERLSSLLKRLHPLLHYSTIEVNPLPNTSKIMRTYLLCGHSFREQLYDINVSPHDAHAVIYSVTLT